MTDALLSMIGFDSHFPKVATPADPFLTLVGSLTPVDQDEADDQARAAHVARVAPELERIYAADPSRVDEAFNDVGCDLRKKHAPLLAAIFARDEAEIGRLLLAGIDARIKAVAVDAAEEDSYRAVPERPL